MKPARPTVLLQNGHHSCLEGESSSIEMSQYSDRSVNFDILLYPSTVLTVYKTLQRIRIAYIDLSVCPTGPYHMLDNVALHLLRLRVDFPDEVRGEVLTHFLDRLLEQVAEKNPCKK